LSDQDRSELQRLRRAEISVIARDVPSARKIELEELLEQRSG
jgi:mannose/fructose/N-acetylgalactosamine-specific phosphotransferase system component IIB